MQPGVVLAERYAVQAPISRGAMGSVHRALDRETGDEVAVKRLTDLTQVGRFEIEARLLSLLSHPRVVRVLDHFTDANGAFIVMELVRGEDLGEVLRALGDPGLPVDVVLTYAQQTCEALDYVHEQHIVHRDVKPDNLILGENGIILVDFGVARELRDPGLRRRRRDGRRRHGRRRHAALHGAGDLRRGSGLRAQRRLQPRRHAVGAADGRAAALRRPQRAVRSRAGVGAELSDALRAGMELMPERRIASIDAFARAIGRPLRERQGSSFVRSATEARGRASLNGSIARTAAGVFDAAAVSIGLVEPATGELVFRAAWGAGADDIVGVRLAAGVGLAGSVVASRRAVARRQLPRRPALRRADRRQHGLRPAHDADRSAAPRRQRRSACCRCSTAETATPTAATTSRARRCSPSSRSTCSCCGRGAPSRA